MAASRSCVSLHLCLLLTFLNQSLGLQNTPTKEDYLEMARLAERGRRYPDMLGYVKSARGLGGVATDADVRLLVRAVAGVVAVRRAGLAYVLAEWRAAKEDNDEKQYIKALVQFKTTLRQDLDKHCSELVAELDTMEASTGISSDARATLLLAKGNCNRYVADIKTGADRQAMIEKAKDAYNKALSLCKSKFRATNANRLTAAMNLAIVHADLQRDYAQAIAVSKEALNAAKGETPSDDRGKQALAGLQANLQTYESNLAALNEED